MARIIQTNDLTDSDIKGMSELARESIYCGLDSCITMECLHEMLPMLDSVSRATYEFSKALAAPVMEMQLRGLRVDLARRDEVLRMLREQIAEITWQLDTIAKDGIGLERPVLWTSPAQLKQLFYGVMGIKARRHKNANGVMTDTVDREALEFLTQYYMAEPICLRLLALRDLDKKRMFLESSLDPDGRIRTNLNVAGTSTGRLASAMSDFGTGTNMQNVDHALRSVFVADPGMKFANLDLSQADARNVGAICWNLFLRNGPEWAGSYLDACESGDLHTTVCKMAWTNLPWGNGLSDRQVADKPAYRDDSYRQLAKKLGHGSNYMGQPATMAKNAHLPLPLTADFQRRYFKSFSCIPEWHEVRKRQLYDTGTITTLLGRRRTFFGRAADPATQREMIAYEPQSLTADEIDTGIINLFRANIPHLQILLQVHDSVLLQVPENGDSLIEWAIDCLQVPIELAGGRRFVVPVDAKVGWNWGDETPDNPDGLRKFGTDVRRCRVTERRPLNLREA